MSCAVTAQLISTFVFATRIVESLFLNPKFQASSLLLGLYGLVCELDQVGNPNCWFSRAKAQLIKSLVRTLRSDLLI